MNLRDLILRSATEEGLEDIMSIEYVKVKIDIT